MRGAELHGLLALVLQRVDRDEVLRAGEAGALHGVDADAADAGDDDRLTGLHVGRVDRRAPAGGDAAADEHGLLQRQLVLDLDHRRLADRAVLAERADHAHRAVVLLRAGAGEGETAAGELAGEDVRAHVADGLLAGGAPAADAAVGDERADDVVARLHARDAGADLLDDARALVAEDHRQAGLEVAVGDVHVGVAEPGVGVPDEDLALLRAREVELDDLDRLAGLVDDSSLGLHRETSSSTMDTSHMQRWRCSHGSVLLASPHRGLDRRQIRVTRPVVHDRPRGGLRA